LNTFDFDPGTLSEVLQSKRFLALSRSNVDPATIATWNDTLLREMRLLVPVDLQALVVPADGGEPMLRLPMLLAGDGGVPDSQHGMPAPFADGQPRPAGVHLHWAIPDALLRGRLEQVDDGQANRLSLPPLPDRWVVLRILLSSGGREPVVRGWVLEADRAVAVPLEQWCEGSTASQQATPAGLQVQPGQLTGTVGGAVNWSAVYDAVLNRFAFHDPLDDLATAAPDGVDGDAGAYLVAGWWSQPADDPLDSARSADSLGELLDRLRWRLLADFGDARSAQLQRTSDETLRATLGLTTGSRFEGAATTDAPAKLTAAAAAGAAAARPVSPISAAAAMEQPVVSSSKFIAAGGAVFRTDPWHLRSSLLHGAVYGVPLASLVAPDQRPDGSTLRVALGRHDDDVLAALASLPDTPPEQRRDVERLLAAFTAQTLPEIGSPDGLVATEEHEHDAGFGSLPGGIAGSDRFVSGGREGALTAGRRRQTVIEGGVRKAVETSAARSRLIFAAEKPGFAGLAAGATARAAVGRYELVTASELQVQGLMQDPSLDDQQAAQPREVARPTPPYEFPTDPLVAVQGPARSLRHGGDGRGSADGKLGCRWPTQVISAVQGLLDGGQLLPSLGNGSIPDEVLLLAREVLLHDPYHLRWLTAAAPLPDESLRGAAGLRLQAEAALRFGLEASYDGGTSAFASTAIPQTAGPRAAAAPTTSSPLERRLVADELRRFSLVRGADPDLVGVTAWSQPWVPLWLEWEATLTGPAGASLEGWQLGGIDLDPADGQQPPQPATRTLSGRSLLTTGAATTMRRAVLDYLAAENSRDAAGSGEIDDQTQTALAELADGVANVDVLTAPLDGLRLQLLGLPFDDGLRRAADGGGGLVKPAPEGPPTLLIAGSLQLTRARLVDAFGRLLELPLDTVATTVDTTAGPGALQQRPRLTRPARWLLRLVDAAAGSGDLSAADARVDQVDPSTQVNPVCGFLLPNHLDESLEVHAVDGSPLGELLHDPVAGSVIWEIAAGRAGPADAGPSFGLAPAEQPLGLLAAGLVAADTAARTAGGAGQESPLSALLRAIDTTLWSVDTFAQLGSEHVAGMVGRPIAVVRCQLRLDLLPEDDLDLSNPDRAAERAAAEQALAAVAFPVRVGELTRSDDGVLGFFVDDDYSRYRLVDKAIAELAREAGRNRGQLGLLGQSPTLPPTDPITHPYIAAADSDDTLLLHLGQTVTLTLLLVPTGKVYLTSGIVPRETLQLARDWVAPGLAALAPTLRTGPLLVETDLNDKQQVRLPKVSVYGTNQAFLWRDTPASWRTDAILAATQTALLPDTAAAFRDGWIRAVPEQPGEGQ
jgi:hypothetical protein